MTNPQTKSKKQSIKAKKITIWVASIVIFFLILLFLAPFIQSSLLRYSLDSESNRALAMHQSNIQTSANSYATATAKKLGANSTATYSVTYNSCYTDHNDSGWFANNYNYRCLVTNFSIFEVSDDSPLMKSINRYATAAAQEEGNRNYYGKIYTFDPFLDKTFATIDDLPSTVDIVKSGTYTNVQDVLAVGIVNSSLNVVAYANNEAVANRSELSHHGTQKLDSKKTYIVLKSGEEYFHKDIGCRFPKLVFCKSPV